MTILSRTLKQIQDQDLKAGGTLSATARERLGSLQRTLNLQGGLIFLAVLVGVGVAVWGTILNIHDSTRIAAFAGALGLSVGAALELLRRTWRELGRTSLLLILIEDADEAQVAALIDKLIKDLPS